MRSLHEAVLFTKASNNHASRFSLHIHHYKDLGLWWTFFLRNYFACVGRVACAYFLLFHVLCWVFPIYVGNNAFNQGRL